MITCPFCSSDNIEGVDLCSDCGNSLTDAYLAPPANHVEQSLLQDRVGIIASPTTTVDPGMPVAEVIRTLAEGGIGCVVVVEAGKVVGIFSERDALRKINVRVSEVGQRPVREFMTPQPQTLQADAKIAFAVQRMDSGGYRHLPLVNNHGELVGIISARGILRYLTKKMAEAG